jgi:hypothetical protein
MIKDFAGKSSALLARWLNVGMTEIFAFEEQSLALVFCQRIGEAIAEIESRTMTAFTEIPVRFSGDSCLV